MYADTDRQEYRQLISQRERLSRWLQHVVEPAVAADLEKGAPSIHVLNRSMMCCDCCLLVIRWLYVDVLLMISDANPWAIGHIPGHFCVIERPTGAGGGQTGTSVVLQRCGLGFLFPSRVLFKSCIVSACFMVSFDCLLIFGLPQAIDSKNYRLATIIAQGGGNSIVRGHLQQQLQLYVGHYCWTEFCIFLH